MAYSCLAALLLLTALFAARGNREQQAQTAGGLLGSDLPLSTAAAAAILEAHSGRLLFASNGETALPPASCGKILTALLALDLADMSEQTVISAAAAAVGESSIGLRQGEQLSVGDLLQGALVHSGNDACYALAEACAGSEPLFVHWLNLKAALLGATSCHFVNTNGLPDPAGHSISAVDLARLAAAAMADARFAAIVGSKNVSFGTGASQRSYSNTNKLLWQNSHIVGIKTGTTDAAGPCLVAAYADGAALFISVVLNSRDRYGESMRLLDWAAQGYMLLRPLAAGQRAAYTPESGLLYAASDVCLLLPQQEQPLIRVIWELPRQVRFVDGSGEEIACCQLMAAGKEHRLAE